MARSDWLKDWKNYKPSDFNKKQKPFKKRGKRGPNFKPKEDGPNEARDRWAHINEPHEPWSDQT